jgi:type IV secretory pathway TraG/TraD family ATPase VirD4
MIKTWDVIDGLKLEERVPTLPPEPIAVPTVDGPPIYFSDGRLGQHVLLVGSIGQGKTNTICHLLAGVRAAMKPEDIAVVFDPKGDYLRRFRRPGDIVINNPDGDNDSQIWNLIEELRASSCDPEETLNEIAYTLFNEEIERSQQPFFPLAAKDLFAAVLSNLASNPGSTNASIRDYWDSKSRQQILADLQSKGETRGVSHYIGIEGQQALGVLGHVLQVTHGVFIGRFRQPGNLSIRMAVRNRGARCVFIEYRVSSGKALAPVYKVLVDLAIKEALGGGLRRGRVFMFIDEFRLLPRLLHMDHGVNFGREFGLRFVVAMQNQAQVSAAYSEEAESILSGFNTVFAFRVSNPETREFIKGLAGQNRKRFAVPSLVMGPPVQQIIGGHVVEDHNISDLRPGEAVIFTPGCAPFVAQMALYQERNVPER